MMLYWTKMITFMGSIPMLLIQLLTGGHKKAKEKSENIKWTYHELNKKINEFWQEDREIITLHNNSGPIAHIMFKVLIGRDSYKYQIGK